MNSNLPKGIAQTITVLLTAAMDVAVRNGANSITMPDEYVELAQWLSEVDNRPIDFSIKQGDIVKSINWELTPLVVVDVNWALRAVALRLGEQGGIVVWPVAGLRKVVQ